MSETHANKTQAEWTVTSLLDLRRRAQAMGRDFDLTRLADELRVDRLDVNRALDALTGRDAWQALAVLSAGPAPKAWQRPDRSIIGRFVAEILGG